VKIEAAVLDQVDEARRARAVAHLDPYEWLNRLSVRPRTSGATFRARLCRGARRRRRELDAAVYAATTADLWDMGSLGVMVPTVSRRSAAPGVTGFAESPGRRARRGRPPTKRERSCTTRWRPVRRPRAEPVWLITISVFAH
jgi:hypothetical protein